MSNEAFKEDRLEYIGEEDISTKYRKKYIEFLDKHKELDDSVSIRDIELILNTFYLYPEMAKSSLIKLIVLNSLKKGGYSFAEEKVKDLAKIFEQTKYEKPLLEYKKWIRYKSYVPQIRRMKKQNISNSEIAEKFGISTAEVALLLDDNIKEPDFFIQ